MLSLSATACSSAIMPGIGLLREDRPLWLVLGAVGIVAFALTNTLVLCRSVDAPGVEGADRGWRIAFVVCIAASVPLVAPVSASNWQTWAWIGASILGTLPLLLRPPWAGAAAVAVCVVGAGVAMTVGGSPLHAVAIIALIGPSLALINWGPSWLWRLVIDVRAGRDAVAVLAVTEERLRFAREVHDILGHTLSVIALKAELLERTGHRATHADEATEIRRLAASALEQVRAAVSGSRQVDLTAELHALSRVLEASGVRCSLRADAAVPAAHAAVLAPISREAVTNVLRHSRARMCSLSLLRTADAVVLIIRNDGAPSAADADPASGGLAGIRDRLRDVDGALSVTHDDDVFELRATIGASA